MGKYKPGDKFIVEITGIDKEPSSHGYPHPAYEVKGAGAFSENVLDKLERINPSMAAAPKTNMDRIKNMPLDELAENIWCPYVKQGYLPCMDEDLDSQGCLECRREWLQKGAEDTNGKNNP